MKRKKTVQIGIKIDETTRRSLEAAANYELETELLNLEKNPNLKF